jgi:hypothetical protein
MRKTANRRTRNKARTRTRKRKHKTRRHYRHRKLFYLKPTKIQMNRIMVNEESNQFGNIIEGLRKN